MLETDSQYKMDDILASVSGHTQGVLDIRLVEELWTPLIKVSRPSKCLRNYSIQKRGSNESNYLSFF